MAAARRRSAAGADAAPVAPPEAGIAHASPQALLALRATPCDYVRLDGENGSSSLVRLCVQPALADARTLVVNEHVLDELGAAPGASVRATCVAAAMHPPGDAPSRVDEPVEAVCLPWRSCRTCSSAVPWRRRLRRRPSRRPRRSPRHRQTSCRPSWRW